MHPTAIVPLDSWGRLSVLKIAGALVFYAAIIGGNRIAKLIDRVREHISPDIFVGERTVRVFRRGAAAGSYSPVCVFNVKRCNKATRVSVGRTGVIHIDDGAVLMKSDQFPRTAVMIGDPSAVKNVAKTEVAV